MDDAEGKEESSNETSNDATTSEKDAVANLNSQIVELKREHEALKKKLHKAEFERDSARKNAENLKSEVKELSKKLQEERKRNAESKQKSGNALQQNENIQGGEYFQLNQNKHAQRTEATENKDLRTSLEEAATDAMSQSGFVYDDRTGLYYDWNTGYYYDPNSCLYYENTTGIYYYYDEQSATYKFHSRVDISSSKKEMADKDNEGEQEERESGEECSEEDEESDQDEVTEVQFPCIRAIVMKSAKMKVGSLFIITYIGGTIGREKDLSHVIRLPDVEVSKTQCQIEFDKERRQFFISDVGSRNGTYLNGVRLSESKQRSKPQVITHGDELTLGTTTLHLHIHPGSQTCDSCEPGQVQAQAQQGSLHVHVFAQDDEVCITKVVEGGKPVNSLTVQEQRKSVLKRIKKAYALEESSFCEPAIDVTLTGKYKDRAEVRRIKVGSDVPVVIADDAPASVHRPISTANVGRQMLEKMGWNEGEGLGREGAGRREPVIVEVRDSLRGLGAGVKRSLDDGDGKNYIRAKTRERFGQATHVLTGPQRFVAAKTVQVEDKDVLNLDANKETSLIGEANSNHEQTPESNKGETMDIFVE